jgi:hypothetical protein
LTKYPKHWHRTRSLSSACRPHMHLTQQCVRSAFRIRKAMSRLRNMCGTCRDMSTGKSNSNGFEQHFKTSSFSLLRVGIESVKGESTNAYLAATQTRPAPVKEEPMAITPTAPSDSDSDSN